MLAKLTHQRLRYVLSFLLVVTFSLPAVIAGIGFYHYMKRMETEEIGLDLEALAQAKADLTRDWLQERLDIATAVAQFAVAHASLTPITPHDDSVSDGLDTLIRFYGTVLGGAGVVYDVYRPEGRLFVSESGNSTLSPPVVEAIRKNGSAVSIDWSDTDGNQARLSLFVPFNLPDESPNQFLGVHLNPRPLFDLVTRVYLGSSEHVHLADRSGRLLTGAGPNGYVPPPLLAGGEGRSGVADAEPGRLLRYKDERGIEIVGSYVALPDLGGKLLIERDYDEAFQRLSQLHTVLWSLLAVIVVLGSTLSIIIANLTVSRLERREQELRTTHQQLITADRLASVGMMAASVAHEINNPLTTIKVLIHSLREELPGNEVRREDLGIVLSEIDKMKALVLRFLQFARPRDPEFSSVDLGQTLARIVSLIRPQVQSKGLTLVERYDDSAGSVWADAGQIGQVFLNILLNAVDATPAGGEIHVTMLRGADDGVTATIWNSGSGLPEELRERIFEPFFSTKPTGTGLGLSIARTIVGKHQGTIHAAGDGEKGTSFVISLQAGSRETT